jgi:radical SAM protein with 4Fe4S-binding SPASM domain
VVEPDNSDEIENNEESVKRSIYTENNKVSNDPMFCMGGRCSYWVSWDGRMLPCSMMSNPSANPFDLGFDAAWEQTKDNIKYITSPKECDECKYKKYCPVCPGRLQSETGNFESLSPYICDVAKSQYLKYAK